eukprot:251321_1
MEPFSLQLEHQLTNALENRRRSGKLRRLRVVNPEKYDFSSNDYLGFARDRTLFDTVETELRELRKRGRQPTETVIGSGGSRLLTGNSYYAEEVERRIAEFHSGHSALLFNNGYMANLSLLSSLPQLGQIVLYDVLVHNSIKEGLRLSRARMKVIIYYIIGRKNSVSIFSSAQCH